MTFGAPQRSQKVKSAAPCPLMVALRRLGGRWPLLVVRALSGRPRRFNELLRDVPQIPSKSLARVLSKLEIEGLVRREVSTGRPPQVSYSLVSNDPLLSEVIAVLFRWGSKHGLIANITRLK